jgi:hypothetical protein
MFHAGILLEGLKDCDPFSFGKATYKLGGGKDKIIVQNLWIIRPQLIAKLSNRGRNQNLVVAGINMSVT